MTNKLRRADAGNRSLRVLLQGVGFAILAAVVMVLYPVLSSAHGWDDLHWSLLGFSLLQAVGTAVLAYFMRTVLDPSGFPTPLPPANSGEPADHDPAVPPEAGRVALLLVLPIAAGLSALALVAALAGPAAAYAGNMDYADYWYHNTGETQSNVEAHCGCSGEKIDGWTDASGSPVKVTEYVAGGGFTATIQGDPIQWLQIQYRYWSGGWHVNHWQFRCSHHNVCILDSTD